MDPWVWFQVPRKLICLKKPDASVFEVVKKLSICLWANFPGPDNLGTMSAQLYIQSSPGHSGQLSDDVPSLSTVFGEFSLYPGTMLMAFANAAARRTKWLPSARSTRHTAPLDADTKGSQSLGEQYTFVIKKNQTPLPPRPTCEINFLGTKIQYLRKIIQSIFKHVKIKFLLIVMFNSKN